MPKPKTQAIQPSLYLLFLESMASKYALGLFIAGNLAPYILTIASSDMHNKTYEFLNVISAPVFILISLELLTARFAYKKDMLDTAILGIILMMMLTKEVMEKTTKPAFLLQGFFKHKAEDEKKSLRLLNTNTK